MPASGMAKKGSGQFGLSKEVGGTPNSTSTTKPGDGGGSNELGMSKKGSGTFSVDRGVAKPPTRKPGK